MRGDFPAGPYFLQRAAYQNLWISTLARLDTSHGRPLPHHEHWVIAERRVLVFTKPLPY